MYCTVPMSRSLHDCSFRQDLIFGMAEIRWLSFAPARRVVNPSLRRALQYKEDVSGRSQISIALLLFFLLSFLLLFRSFNRKQNTIKSEPSCLTLLVFMDNISQSTHLPRCPPPGFWSLHLSQNPPVRHSGKMIVDFFISSSVFLGLSVFIFHLNISHNSGLKPTITPLRPKHCSAQSRTITCPLYRQLAANTTNKHIDGCFGQLVRVVDVFAYP